MARGGAALVAWVFSMAPPIAAEQSPSGVIHGHVRLAADAPSNPTIRMGADPACSQLNAGRRLVQEFVLRNPEGGLANAFVHLQGAFPHTQPPSASVALQQRGCVYQPHVIGMQVGQRLQVTNADPTLHNVHSLSTRGNDFNTSQLAGGAPFIFSMRGEEMMLRITCDIHSWMNIFVGVVNHPYFAVSGGDGSFEIAGVPAGRQTVQVWHERYGPLTAEAIVTPDAPAVVDFTYLGTEKAAPASSVASLVLPAGGQGLLFR